MKRARNGGRIRLSVQQPALPKYRVPVFRELARRPGIALELHYADNSTVPSCSPDGFLARTSAMRTIGHGDRTICWHSPQWTCATRQRSDVLILSWNSRYASLVPALIRARAGRVPTILWGHGYSKHESPSRRSLRYAIGRLATAVLVYNRTTAEQLVADGWPEERVHVALNSLDQTPIRAARDWWTNHPTELAAFRRQHGLGSGPTLLFVSRLCKENRAELLLEAGQYLQQARPGLKIVLIGRGEDEQRLRSIAGSMGLGDSVIFAGAIYEEDQLAPWFLSSEVFCYPVNIGLSILHAFGYGIPVVTSDLTGAQNPEIEALQDGQNGLLYRDGDVAALAAGLERIIDDPSFRAQLSAGASNTVLHEFTIERMVDGIVGAVEYAYHARE